jgi:hypothetical protein
MPTVHQQKCGFCFRLSMAILSGWGRHVARRASAALISSYAREHLGHSQA